MVCHVVPPMRFAEEACETLERAIPRRISGATDFSRAGRGNQSRALWQVLWCRPVAETLAGLVFSWLVDPDVAAIFAPKPLVAGPENRSHERWQR